jgi:hypothetical protein
MLRVLTSWLAAGVLALACLVVPASAQQGTTPPPLVNASPAFNTPYVLERFLHDRLDPNVIQQVRENGCVYKLQVECDGWRYVLEVSLDRDSTDLNVVCLIGQKEAAEVDASLADMLREIVKKHQPRVGPLRVIHRVVELRGGVVDNFLCLMLSLDNRQLTPDEFLQKLQVFFGAAQEVYTRAYRPTGLTP